jgi:hypothetical protein
MLATPALMLANLPMYLVFSPLHVVIYEPVQLLVLIFFVLRHAVSVLSLAFLYEVAFGAKQARVEQ